MTDYFIRKAIKKAVKEGTEQEELEEMLSNVIGLWREETEIDTKRFQDVFLRECLEDALQRT